MVNGLFAVAVYNACLMHCTTETMTLGELLVKRNVIDDQPTYQRESGIWSKEKQQLFLDSILNNLDVPKLYFHDLRGNHARYHFAVIDGKQRLHAIWDFFDNKYDLDEEFSAFNADFPDPPKGGEGYDQFSKDWVEIIRAKKLDVVLIQNATEDDIEELFSRLNNGEPLTAAEKRNAMHGDMANMIREVSQHSFFKKVRFGNTRFAHLETAAKFILMTKSELDGGSPIVDLKKKHLDALADHNRAMPEAFKKKLLTQVNARVGRLAGLFGAADALLSKQAYVPIYFLFVNHLHDLYAGEAVRNGIRPFLEKFQTMRLLNLERDEETRDSVLVDFGRLMQQGTNDAGSLKQRLSILTRFFLLEHPDVEIKDPKRAFTEEERTAIYHLAGKKCSKCKKPIADISEMDADHVKRHADGGRTTLANARALCIHCNRKNYPTPTRSLPVAST